MARRVVIYSCELSQTLVNFVSFAAMDGSVCDLDNEESTVADDACSLPASVGSRSRCSRRSATRKKLFHSTVQKVDSVRVDAQTQTALVEHNSVVCSDLHALHRKIVDLECQLESMKGLSQVDASEKIQQMEEKRLHGKLEIVNLKG